ncbi:MAG: integration host factor subunit alpha [Rhodobacteraceae bacterium]|nr:integration host factor subunit alpha [Paracoccaceae bacterium]MBT4285301.1 integration host factor subunit alpha [Paracoccaceae bacterium]MBT4776807.1 integration host factor subunit alpha [Paracoccaceae bacterium]MBT6270857.1 integration host factor subunit alpha [Paracoccaceae bacterium]MDG1298338.1 integration host factor subunit alpha [Paracoccaceae bacterium]|tara:strand:- start:707 stop:1006 length:300 start_codon:yes stop_codon:yes gene_type:complete
MSSKTLTRIELSEAVYREVGLSRNESAELVETVLNHISNALIKGEQVKISAFGTFNTRNKKQRIGRNPKTGTEIPITSRRVISFKASQIMKEKVAAGNK